MPLRTCIVEADAPVIHAVGGDFVAEPGFEEHHVVHLGGVEAVFVADPVAFASGIVVQAGETLGGSFSQ